MPYPLLKVEKKPIFTPWKHQVQMDLSALSSPFGSKWWKEETTAVLFLFRLNLRQRGLRQYSRSNCKFISPKISFYSYMINLTLIKQMNFHLLICVYRIIVPFYNDSLNLASGYHSFIDAWYGIWNCTF